MGVKSSDGSRHNTAASAQEHAVEAAATSRSDEGGHVLLLSTMHHRERFQVIGLQQRSRRGRTLLPSTTDRR